MHVLTNFPMHQYIIIMITIIIIIISALLSAATADAAKCPTLIPRDMAGTVGWENSRHFADCQLMQESHYSYSVQSVAEPTDSMQNTKFADINNSNNKTRGLTGSFELEHRLEPSDTLWIILGGRVESRLDSSHTCQRLSICGLTVDGLSHRLRLNVTLGVHKSYTMKIYKFASGSYSPELCEAPEIRFFYTRSSAVEMPLIQIGAKNCSRCSDVGHFKCLLDMYLMTADRLNNGIMQGGLVQVLGSMGINRINFTDLGMQRRNGWIKRPFELAMEKASLRIDIFKLNSHRRNFYMVNRTDKSFQSLLCQPSLTLASCPTGRPEPQGPVAIQPPFRTAQGDILAANPAIRATFALFVALILLALMAALICIRLWQPTSRRLALVFDNDLVSNAEAVGRFRRELLASDVIKRHRLHVQEFVGLRRLTPDVAKHSRLIIFISHDAKFSGFQLDSMSDNVRLTLKTVLATEKHRTLGFYIKSENHPPQVASYWASLNTKCLSVRDARNCVKHLTALCDMDLEHTTMV